MLTPPPSPTGGDLYRHSFVRGGRLFIRPLLEQKDDVELAASAVAAAGNSDAYSLALATQARQKSFFIQIWVSNFQTFLTSLNQANFFFFFFGGYFPQPIDY